MNTEREPILTPDVVTLVEGPAPTPQTEESAPRARLVDGARLAQIRRRVHGMLFAAPDPVRVGRYTVIERVGAGGMGVVYAAYDRQLDRKVALKLVRSGAEAGSDELRRLIREAQALARLDHPCVVQVFDVGEFEQQMYISMEFVEGVTLGRWLEQRPRRWHEVVDCLLPAGEGLAAAHDRDLVHRDFKPDNVLVGEDGRVRVVDFGVARVAAHPTLADLAADSPSGGPLLEQDLTRTGTMVGTPRYMAPEQLGSGALGPWTDQFAFGVVLYEALYGQRPFDADTLQGLAKAVLGGELRPAPGRSRVPARIRRVVMRALQTDPQRRFGSMRELLHALRRARHAGRRTLGAGAVLVVGLLAWWGYQAWQDREHTHAARTSMLAEARDAEAERATAAEDRLRQREDAVTLAEARLELDIDPTQSVALLNNLSPQGWTDRAREIASEAAAKGVARRVVPRGRGEWLHATPDLLVLARVDDGGTELWDPSQGRGEVVRYTPVLVSRDGGTSLSCCDPQGAPVVRRAERETILPVRFEDIGLFSLSPHGRQIGAYAEGVLTLWEHDDPEPIARLKLGDVEPSIIAVDGDRAYVIDAGGHLEVWTSQGSRSIAEGISGPLELSADGRWLAALDQDRGLVVWSTSDLTRRIHDTDQEYSAIALAAEGSVAAAWAPPGEQGSCLAVWTLAGSPRRQCAAGSPDGTSGSLSLSANGRVLLVRTDAELRLLDLHRAAYWSPPRDESIVDATLSPGAEGLITLHADGLDLSTREWVMPAAGPMPLPGHDGEINALAFAGTSRTLWSAGEDGLVKRWHLDSGQALTVAVHPRPVTALAVRADGTSLSRDDEGVTLADGQGEHHRLALDGVEVKDVTFSSDGKAIVATRDEMLVVDPASGEIERRRSMPRKAGWFTARWARLMLEQPERYEGQRQTEGTLSTDLRWLLPFPNFTKISSARIFRHGQQQVIDTSTGQSWQLEITARAPVAIDDRGRVLFIRSGSITLKDTTSDMDLWLPTTSSLRRTHTVAFSPDGQTIAIPDEDDHIHLVSTAFPEGDALREWAAQATDLRLDPLAIR